MGLFDGLSKFGMKKDVDEMVGDDLFATEKEKAEAKMNALKNAEAEDDGLTDEERRIELEKSFVLTKHVRCKCCDKTFATSAPKSGRVKRIESDTDLRPRCENFDTLKYGVYHCPHCGYTSTVRLFATLGERDRRAVEAKICSQFKPEKIVEKSYYTYDEAIDVHKLALFTEVVKNGKASDKAYICLLIGWLYRGKAEELALSEEDKSKEIAQCKADEKECLEQAFQGFVKAFSTETAPFAGMDELTTEYLLAALAFELGRYDVATKSIGNIITAPMASSRMKDKARALKDKILEEIRATKQ